jgi:imidazolonepropionase-like amidohydrolase
MLNSVRHWLRASGRVVCAAALPFVASGLPTTVVAQPSRTPPAASPTTSTVLLHATVVDVVNGVLLPDQAVVIRDGRVVSVVPSARATMPRDAARVDVRGRYVIPGLWDMHVHMADRVKHREPGGASATAAALYRYYGALFAAHGVTRVRDMAGDVELLNHIDALSRAPQGPVGPRVSFTGYKLGAGPVVPGAPSPLTSRADVQRAIAMMRAKGAAFVKLSPWVPDERLSDALAECAAQHIPCVGHVPHTDFASFLRTPTFAAIEHLFYFAENTGRAPAATYLAMEVEREFPTLWNRVTYKLGIRSKPGDATLTAMAEHDAAKARALYARMATQGVYVTPTLFFHDLLTRITTTLPGARDTLLMVEAVTDGLRRDVRTPAQRAVHADRWRFALQVVRDLHGAGVPLLAGTDLPLQGVPGASLQAELALMQQAGLSPLEALRTATLNPARYLHATDSLGSVQAGRVADLVVLTRNPLADVANVTSVEMVMLRGRLLPRRALDSLVNDARGQAARIRAWR